MAVTLLMTGYYRHPKMVQANLASGGELAETLWCRALDHANEHKTEGHIAFGVPELLTPTKTKARVRALVGAGLWVEADGGWAIHDYLEWNRSNAQMADLVAKKAAAGKKGANARWGGRMAEAIAIA